jgi:two-component system, NarL family, invasion response regulator UvrY
MQQAHQLSILIVDEQWLIRLGLKRLLGHEYRDVVFGEAATVEEALVQIKVRPWRLVILDISLPDGDGLSVLREICARRPRTAVLILSLHADLMHAALSRQLGAAGYVSQSSGASNLLNAVKSVLDGKKHFTESVRQEGDDTKSATCRASLSAQECRVLLEIAAGRRIGEIAAELNLSAKTVSTYKRRTLNKLGFKSTAELVRYVIDHKLS